MKPFIALALLLAPALAFAETFAMSWDPVTQDISGNNISVSGYNIYWSSVSGQRGTKIGTVTTNSFKFTETKPGTYYGTVTAYLPNSESAQSNEASGTVTPKAPIAPKSFKIILEGTATVTQVN